MSTSLNLLAMRNNGTIVDIGGRSLVAKTTIQMIPLYLNRFLESEYAAMIAMPKVKIVEPNETMRLLLRYLYTELDPGVKAVFIALQSGVKRNLGTIEKISFLVLIDVIAFQ